MTSVEHNNLDRIAYLTSGAANMYCGSCLHDNTLARALNAAGVETLLVPTYTPIRTDEEDVSIDQVFFGGINVFLQQKIPLFRHIPKFVDRILDAPWLIRRCTARGIEISPQALGALTVSMLKGPDGNQRKEVKRLIKWLANDVKPSVVILSNLLIGGCITSIRQHDIPVIVTLQGDDIFLQDLIEPYKSQALKIMCNLAEEVDGFIVQSKFYQDVMCELFEIPRSKIQVVPLGLDLTTLPDPQPPNISNHRTIGYLARMSKEKGLHILVDAFIQLKQLPDTEDIRLLLAGWRGTTNQEYAAAEFAKLDAAGLGNDYEDLGTVDHTKKQRLLNNIDLLCVPTVYQEPKGLFALEAMAAGVPVVLPEHGAFPEMLADLEGGILFEPGNTAALSQLLHTLLENQKGLAEYGHLGRKNIFARRDANTMASNTIAAIQKLLA
jgi:glycosyltransferase involved in cell wall biosynthesis